MTTAEILLKKAQDGKLGHFYIIESSLAELESQKLLVDFVKNFIADYYKKVEKLPRQVTHFSDHPDVFVLGNLPETEDPETSDFTVEESAPLGRFFEFKPVEAKRKFAVITEGHRITSRVANKWLKLLEEPMGESTIFLLNPRGQKLLDTIHSRAIHIRLPAKRSETDSTEWNEFLQEAKTLSLSQFLEAHVRGEFNLEYWTSELLKWESDQLDLPAKKDALQIWVKKLQELETFHQPAATKWALFYSYLHQHVLPRATH